MDNIQITMDNFQKFYFNNINYLNKYYDNYNQLWGKYNNIILILNY